MLLLEMLIHVRPGESWLPYVSKVRASLGQVMPCYVLLSQSFQVRPGWVALCDDKLGQICLGLLMPGYVS
jgi:hypothetical protein